MRASLAGATLAAMHGITCTTPSGLLVTEHVIRAREFIELAVSGEATCLICLRGTGTLQDSDGVALVKPNFMAIRRGSLAARLHAGATALKMIQFTWPAAALATLEPIDEGLRRSRNLYGRSSVELGWRASAELAAGDRFTPSALELMGAGIALGISRGASSRQNLEHTRAARARRLLERRLGSPLDVSAIAAEIGCDPATLSRQFRSVYGMSPTVYVMHQRVDRARRLLEGTSRSIDDIARTLGFHDASHFARQFRRHAGVSPAVFRAAHRRARARP